MDILSPITGRPNTSLILEIEVSKIVDLYLKDQQLDVRKYFHELSAIQIRQCNDTGYRFYYPMDIYGDDAFYQHLQKTGIYYLPEKWEYRKAASLIGNGKKVLEIGSGAGFFMKKLQAGKHARLCGLELNTHQVELSRKNGLDVINETIESFAAKYPGSFDVAVALQVVEHIPGIRSFISASLEVLRPGGQLIICVPHNNPYIYRHDFLHTLNLPPHHAGLWDRGSFSRLPEFFPMRLNHMVVEPLTDFKEYYLTQVNYYKEKKHPIAGLMERVPPMIYKNTLRLLRHFVEGRNIMVEFIKL